MLTEGWRELLTRNGGALTHFDTRAKTGEEPRSAQEFPHWSLLAAETWETAQAVIIRVEVPGTRKEDLDVKLHGNLLVVRGVKRAESEQEERRYNLMERAYGSFARTIPVTHEIDRDRVEVSYQDGVITVILPKREPTPPRQLTVS
jgi:HSP20 family protein